MAGTIPLSMTQQFDEFGKPLAGGQLFLIQAGTVSTPQNGFQDTNLTIPLPYPITLDAAGRIPQFFLADGSIKVRLQDRNGVVQLAADSILVIGPSAGGGGGAAVDPTQLIQMGNMIFRYGIGALTGYVRLNGLSIGSATSGATERVNADCQALFNYLWNTDAALVVSGGRGANSAADWTANKNIALPDWRGYALGALDDMGNAASGRLNSTFFGSSPIVLGAAGGSQSSVLGATHLPPHSHSGTTGAMNQNASHAHTTNGGTNVIGGTTQPAASGGAAFSALSGGVGLIIDPTNIDHSHNFTTNNGNAPAGSATAFANIGPRKLATFYIKL